VFGVDQSERIEAGGVDLGRGLAGEAPPPPRGIADPIERHGVANEAIRHEDARARRRVARIKAEFDLAAGKLRADFQIAAGEPDRPVLADDAPFAVEEDVVEGRLARDRT
jgi:hypothetical protein